MPISNKSSADNMPKLIAALQQMQKQAIQIGVPALEGSELFMIAFVNEYGTNISVTPKMRMYLHYQGLHLKNSTQVIKIPERSYIRAGFDFALPDLQKYVEKALPLVVSGKMDAHMFYQLLGEFAVGKIHSYIQQLRTPPNHPMTIARKGSSHPLISTGRLNQSITYEVVDI